MADDIELGVADYLANPQQAVAPRLKDSLLYGVQQAPDYEAEMRRVARVTGVPLPAAVADEKYTRAQAQVMSIDPNGLIRQAPRTANWLAQPDNAAVAHDDVNVLQEIERTIGDLGKTFPKLMKSSGYGLISAAAGAYQGISPLLRSVGIDPDVSGMGQPDDEKSPMGSYITAIRQKSKQVSDQSMPQTDNPWAAGVNAGVVSFAQNAPVIAAAIASKNPALGIAGAGAITGGQAYGDARDKGLSQGMSELYAGVQGGIEMATEKLPLDALVGDYIKHSGLLSTIFHQLVTEVPGEQIATLGQDFSEWAFLHPDKPFSSYLNSRGDAAISTLVATGVGIGTHSSLSHVAQVVNDRIQGNQVQLQQAGEAGLAEEALASLDKAATASALRQRDPQTFHDFVQAASENSPVDRVYVNAQDLVDILAQGSPEKLAENAQVLQSMPSVMPQLNAAVATGGLVEIPVSELLAFTPETSLGQSLMEHLKVDPEGMSAAEAKVFLQSHEDTFKAEVAKAVEHGATATEFSKSADVVRQNMADQLHKANRFTPDVNEAYANMVGTFYATQAARLNITPEQFFEQHPLTVKAAGVLGDSLTDALSQKDDGSPPRLPSSSTWRPPTPTETEMADHSRVEEVPLDKARSGQTYRYWDAFNAGNHPGDLLDGYGDMPVAARREDGEYVVLDGHHRTEKAMAEGATSLPMHVIDVKDYAPEVAGRPLAPDGMSDDELLRELRDMGFEQSNAADPRGAYSPASNTIVLLRNADLSTFLHETGHFYLETLARVASDPSAPAEIQADWAKAADFIGADQNPAAWLSQSVDQRREGHETFARAFEAYLLEGKAPSQPLQGLFQRFKSWLMHVYQSLGQLNVELTPEVRGVMDRLLATDAEIARAEAGRAFAPVFDTKPDSMTDQEWEAYQRLGSEATADAQDQLAARSIRDMRWLQSTRARIIRQLSREARDKRTAVRSEVEAEVMREPVYAAQQYLKRGLTVEGDRADGTHKLSIEKVAAIYEGTPKELQDWRKLGYGRYGMLAEEGLDPDHVAELFGYTSGHEMVEALLNAPPVQDEIAGRTDQRMLERYGDLTSPEAVERAADMAIHNDARLRFVATEANALAKAVGSTRILAEAARDFARELIGRQAIRDVRPAKYTGAETRAARAAATASAKGDLVEAATQKRNQLINGYAAKAAYQAQTDVEAALRYFDRLQGDAARRAIDPDYRDQIDQLLERFDLRKGQSLKAIDRRKSLQGWIEAQRAKGLDPVIDDALANEAYRKHFKDMTVDELRGLTDAVKNIVHLGKLKNRLLVAAKGRAFQAVVDDAEASIREHAYRTVPDQPEHNTVADKFLSGFRGFLAQHRKLASLIREMGGLAENDSGGILWRTFIEPMNAANDKEASMREQATLALSGIFKPVLEAGGLRKKLFIPEIGRSLTLEGRIAVALNWGNELNRARIQDGNKWNIGQVDAVLKTLTAEQLGFVNQMHEYLDSFWPDIAAKERRVTGVEPEKVEPEAYQITSADGQLVDMRGGYYPIKYDTERSSRSEADEIAEAIRGAMQGAYTRATTRRGHTKARVDKVERPVRLDLSVPFQHVNQVIHDLSFHEYLIDANRLISAPQIDGAIRDHYGVEVLRTMKRTFQDIAEGDAVAENALDRVINHIRTGSTIVGLGLNLMTAAQQPLGLTQSIVRVGPKYMAKGIGKAFADAATLQNTMEQITEKSAFMRLRSKTMMREINEVQNKVSAGVVPEALEKMLGKNAYTVDHSLGVIHSSFFSLITKLQLVADVPTWLGAYDKAQAQGQDDETAVALADQAVRDSQGSGQIGDLAQIQRGNVWFKLWTNFYSFFSIGYNQMAESLAETRRVGPSRLPMLAADVALVAFLPAVLGELLKHALRGDDWDWDQIGPSLAKAQVSYLFGFMVGLRELGGIIQNDGKQSAGPASLRLLTSDLPKLYQQIEQGDLDDAARKAALNTAGILLHFPAAQVNRTIDGMEALGRGDTHNPMALLFGPPRKAS